MADNEEIVSARHGRSAAPGGCPPEVAASVIAEGLAGPAHAAANPRSAPVIACAEEAGGPLPPEAPMTGGQKFRLVGLVILKRLRFIAVLVGVGVFIGYWDTVMNYWDKWTRPRSAASHALEPGHEFYCPMDPQVVRSDYEPNGDVPKCPICGMPLAVRPKGEAAKLPEGITARVQFSPERIQLAGIKTVPVEYRPMARETKTVGYITFDESRLSRIVSRVEGYVEKLYVDETFKVVHKGDPLAEIYSPELYSTARELVLASRDRGVTDLAAAARNRLLLLGVSQQEIDGLVAAGQPSPRLVIRSPQEGYVVDKKIVAGASVEAKMTLFEVAELSTVWVEADVYEKDIPFLQAGQHVEATVEAYPNRTFNGKLALVYPQLEAATRTNRIRLKLDNPRDELRPGMFATVRIKTPLESIEPFKSLAAKHAPRSLRERARVRAAALEKDGDGTDIKHTSPHPRAPTEDWSLPKGEGTEQYEFLTVPERAVVDTGEKKVVYVEREPGLFEGVEVALGPRQGGYYPVVKGLKAGDKLAAAGAFLIDAETRLNPAAAATYFGASGGPQAQSNPVAPRGRTQHHAERDEYIAAAKQRTPLTTREVAQHHAERDEYKAPAVPEPENLKNIEQLPKADRRLALAQRICPVTGAALGSMGVPVKITLRGQTVFLCCKGCMGKAKRNPDQMLKIVAKAKRSEDKKP
jgi:membrane fusion protein, copper/silver efflux system